MPNNQEIQKETVIIVHGTWAAPQPRTVRWYEPPLGNHTDARGFTAKLDAALQQRGSPARCWAHCTEVEPIFEWSGQNSWIARTRAAAVLGAYVSKLQNLGWLCHIVAHSHGGNVVVEALRPMLAAVHSFSGVGKITTLGTPFIDTKLPISKERKETRSLRRIALYLAMVLLILPLGGLLIGIFEYGITGLVANTEFGSVVFILLFSVGLLVYARRPQSFHGLTLDDISPWLKITQTAAEVAGIQLDLLAIGSRMDEAWQILHHMRNIHNPLAVDKSLAGYLFASLRSRMSLAAETDAILGAESFKDLTAVGKVFCILLWVAISFLLLLFVILIGEGLFLTKEINLVQGCGIILGLLFVGDFFVLAQRQTGWQMFYSVPATPLRWYSRLSGALLQIPTEVVTYFVRRKSWSVLVAIAMGLEGYRFELPHVEQRPDFGTDQLIIYEDMPKGAELRALDRRTAWIAHHLGDVSQTFSKLAVTAADISSLLTVIEADQTLVHAAYYTDDECIARIADWIASKG